ncbi:MAG TPA: hypothetical protein VMJ10_23410 [Kofleriaceae bacterium]|nr:hypothetical protein [Kofleriaceae bacterium]
MVRFHMRERYTLLGAIQHLAIRGEVYETQVLARLIGSSLDEPGLAKWRSQAGFARSNAHELSMAPTTEEACKRTARLAATCAACHVDAKVVPLFAVPPPLPPDGASVDARMARHVWATDRLFEGIIGGADESWLAGLDVLAQTPAPSVADDTERVAFARRLQGLANDTKNRGTKDDFAARARAYGEILVVCSACHAAEQRKAK